MTIDLDAWRATLVESLRPLLASAFDAMTADLPAADVVGLGVYSDSDAGSIIPAVNTRAHRDALATADPAWAEDYSWSIGEWDRTPFDVPAAAHADGLNAELERVHRTATEGQPAERLGDYRRSVWGAIAAAMAELFEAGFFDRWPDAVQVFIPADGVVPDTTLADWNEACNSAADAARFRDWAVAD